MTELGSIVIDKLREVAKSTQLFADNFFPNSGRTAIQILKSLQREAFSDIMKLRDRQEKVEKLLAMCKSSKGSPFQEDSTHVKGRVDIIGALFFMDDVDEQKYEAIQKSGIRTGIDARLTFKTSVGDNHRLVAEFTASEKGRGDALGGPLTLSKVLYSAHIFSWLSAVAVPLGAQYRDAIHIKNTYQERGLTDYSEFGPPLLNQYNGSAIGITATKSKVTASLAQFVSGLGMQLNSSGMCTGIANTYSTVGEIAWQISNNTKLSLLGVQHHSKPSGQSVNLGTFAFPVSIFERNRFPETLTSSGDEDSPTSWERSISDRSVALLLKSEIDESTRIGGWLEMRNSNPRYVQWGATIRDVSEDDFGWGFTVGGCLEEHKNLEHLQVESFVKMNIGRRFKIEPGFMYVKDGSTQFPALMLRSTWSL